MSIEFYLPLAKSDQFPTIIYGATPRLKFRELCRQNQLTGSPAMLFTQSGRTALAIAGQQLKQTTNIILIPTYHCPAAIEPFIWLGYQCVFYRVNSDLSPDISDIKQLVKQHNITHCLVINYFGVACYLSSLIESMQARGIVVIHDCAHALFEVLDLPAETCQADATICSINKLLPSIDGGILVLKDISPGLLPAVAMWQEAKAVSYFLGITKVINKLRHYFASERTHSNNNHSESPTAAKFRYFSPVQIDQRCFSHTILLLSHTNLQQVRQRRRDNYLYLLALLKDSDNGHVLFEQITKDAVPYVLPYLLNNAKDFTQLRQAGIQSLRWEEIAKTDCEISQHYRHCLVQLPCHHQLTKSELHAMAQKIKDI